MNASETTTFALPRWILAIVAVVLLLATGALLRLVEAPAWRVVKAGQPELNLAQVDEVMGRGLVLGLLGGFRTLSADIAWLTLNGHWERRDIAKVNALIKLATTLAPNNSFFWRNGAQTVAYDISNWRIVSEGGYDIVPQKRQDEIDREQVDQAFALLDQAIQQDPDDYQYNVTKAIILKTKLKDLEGAAEQFRLAAEFPNAPYFLARIHAQLLRDVGEEQKAWDYLTNLYRTLPDDEIQAQKDVILERIRAIEEALSMDESERFRP